jgi:hypothetical protein
LSPVLAPKLLLMTFPKHWRSSWPQKVGLHKT